MNISIIQRVIQINDIIEEFSLFLLGPRQTGKSTLLSQRYPDAFFINLLETQTVIRYQQNPDILLEVVEAQITKHKYFIIDEIQKVPELLNSVHMLMEKHKHIRFILTGSSARKLRREGVNLLGGRAFKVHLCPFVYPELRQCMDFPMAKRLFYGSLPAIVFSQRPKLRLQAYVSVYLKEEIQAEALVRNLPAFSSFLKVAALCHGQQIQYEKVGSDCAVNTKTIKNYFILLEDTLMGQMLPCYQKSPSRKAMTIPKFYFFDIGIVHALEGTFEFEKGSLPYGRAFETIVYSELSAYLKYNHQDSQLFYWRSKSHMEVDFVVEHKNTIYAFEVKGKNHVGNRDLTGLMALREDHPEGHFFVICEEPVPRKTPQGILILPLEVFLKELWEHSLFKS